MGDHHSMAFHRDYSNNSSIVSSGPSNKSPTNRNPHRFSNTAPWKGNNESLTARGTSYSYDPYNQFCSVLVHVPHSQLPEGTLHAGLEGHVSFVPYPNTPFRLPSAPYPKKELARIFIGQLPYQVTNMQLAWLCHTFGNGGRVVIPERIMKRDHHHGGKVPTGCIHAYCDPDLMKDMVSGMHKRILVDDTGVWYAETHEQIELLNTYCLQLKMDKRKRIVNRPYDTVVVQYATSSYGCAVNSSNRRNSNDSEPERSSDAV